jgi:bifunctional non-homologous end joining protein LigD
MRDFAHTPEPAGKGAAARPRARGAFVVQKHDATRLHYDFRLELGGVLKSWAVPKGPSLDPGTKRLAVETEDHPLEYASFEGVIPAGAYGAGPVIVWDRGRWTPEGDPDDGYQRGRLEFTLDGEKLRGRWRLLRLGGRSGGGKRAWLLVKRHDEEARTGTRADLPILRPESVRTGRKIEALAPGAPTKARAAARRPRVGGVRRTAAKPPRAARPRPPVPSRARARGPAPARIPGARPAPLPLSFGPQLCTLVNAAPEGAGWIHEIKFDGYRMLCRVQGGRARLVSRNGKDWTSRFARVAEAAARLPVREALLDGEVVRFDTRGRTSFQALQAALTPGTAGDVVYCVFDLLHLDGHDLSAVPLLERKRALAGLLGRGKAGVLRTSDHVVGEGPAFHAAACREGLEGIVSKRADGHHVAARTREWLKVRCGKRQEFAIVGFTPHSAQPRALGSLLLGVKDAGRGLRYAGKVGTGFSDAVRSDLRARLERDAAEPPAFARGLHVPGAVWVRPRLVAEVAYTEWTQDGLLRHPTFQGLREDKEPGEVVEERPAALPPRDAPAPGTRRRRASGPRSPASPAGGDTFSGVRLTHPDRVLWPGQGLTKAQLAAYYVEISGWVLPEVVGRPLTLVRCPEGQGKPCFFQKHPGKSVATGLGTVDIRESEGKAPYLVVQGTDGLVALVQMGALELHTWGSRADDVERPDRIVIDLDPDPSVPFARVVAAAREVRARLEALGLAAFVKTTGGKGLHVVTPLLRKHGWDEVKGVAHALAESLVRDEPALYLAKASKAARRGKIFVDWLRNTRGATAIASYSTRARAGAPVSVPLAWDELDARLDPAAFTLETVPRRLRALRVDPWAGYARAGKGLARASKALGVEAT